ncbi:MAG: S-layer homology domain-containing protein [Clostridia bacterium]|nr:S-layer homology domain-containing protein [Clostridia bacterium]
MRMAARPHFIDEQAGCFCNEQQKEPGVWGAHEKQRLLALALALLMLLSLAPVTARAAKGGVAINETNFLETNSRDVVKEFDTNGDHVLSKTERNVVQLINCAERNIGFWRGIAFFHSLIRLDCYRNQLTKLDVSNNPVLITLNCGDNQFIEVDARNCFTLVSVRCGDQFYPLVANHVTYVFDYLDGTFRPDQPITRAEASAFINHALGRGVTYLEKYRNFTDNQDGNARYIFEIIEVVNGHEHIGSRPDEIWTMIW